MRAKRRSASGQVWIRNGVRGKVAYMSLRRPDGSETSVRLGKLWTGSGKAPDGYVTKRDAERRRQQIIVDADRGQGVGAERSSDKTVGEVAEEWLEHGAAAKGWKISTVRDRRSLLNVWLLPAFGDWRLDELTPQAIERWQRKTARDEHGRRAAIRTITALHAVCAYATRAEGLPANPVARVERLRAPYDPTRLDFYSVAEVHALVRAAADEVDAAIFQVAAFSGLRRGEVLALRVRDVDFDGELIRVERAVDETRAVSTPKSGHGRVVPLVPQLATTLARLLQRDRFTGADDLLFPNPVGGFLEPTGVYRRFLIAAEEAGLKRLRFHDLRHSFGSTAVAGGATLLEVQAWMGHSSIQTTMRYLHFAPRGDEAKRLGRAFAVETIPEEVAS